MRRGQDSLHQSRITRPRWRPSKDIEVAADATPFASASTWLNTMRVGAWWWGSQRGRCMCAGEGAGRGVGDWEGSSAGAIGSRGRLCAALATPAPARQCLPLSARAGTSSRMERVDPALSPGRLLPFLSCILLRLAASVPLLAVP